MEDRPDFPEYPTQGMTRERFEALLLEIRNGAYFSFAALVGEELKGAKNEAKLGDLRSVWHAAEFALGMVSDSYLPRREAIDDAAVLIERLRRG